MKICRNGVEIELTNIELMDAAHEYQKICDVADIMSIVDYHVDEHEFEEAYGITVEQLKEIAPACAVRYRHYMDDDGRWFDNASWAISEIVSERGLSA